MKRLNNSLLNARKDKHFKLSQRFIKLLQSGSFKKYSRRKQYRIVERIKKLERQLKDYRVSQGFNFNIDFKHWALALALGVVSYGASGQDKPSEKNRKAFGVEREANKEKLIKNYQMLSTPGARTAALDFLKVAELGHPPLEEPVAGDYDGDGDLDILYELEGIPKIYTLTNQGGFTFKKEDTGVSVDLEAPISADFDGDGDTDIVTAGDSVQYLLRNTAGNFTKEDITFESSSDFQELFHGDVDGDGDLDLVFKPWSSAYINVALNDGSAGFTLGVQNDNVLHLHDLADIDGDGDLDVLVNENYDYVVDPYNSYSKQRLSYFTNDGSGQFLPTNIKITDPQYNQMEAGDIDGDGDADIVLVENYWDGVNERLDVETWINNGSGSFTAGNTTSFNDGYAWGVDLVDIDGDADLDIYFSEAYYLGSPLMINDGAGNFTLHSQEISYSDNGIIGDFDGDSDLDLLSFSYSSADAWRNDGNLIFTNANENIVELSTTTSVKITDMNNDGTNDLVMMGASKIWNNSGDGISFTVGQRLNTADFDQVILDIDSDGDNDIITTDAESPGNILGRIWINNNGTLDKVDTLTHAYPVETYRMASGDIDGDSDIDIMYLVEIDTSSYYDENQIISTWKNTGGGSFTSSSDFVIDGFIDDFEAGDIDGDGDIDLLMANESYGLSLATNDGTGNFTMGDTISVAAGEHDLEQLEIGDFDGDGDIDAFLINSSEDNLTSYLFKNDGTGLFTYSPVVTPFYATGVTSGDIDNDGDTDLVLIGSSYNEANEYYYIERTVLLNDGTGNFSDSGINMRSQGYGYGYDSHALGDLDNDGDLDLASGSIYSPLEVWQNQLLMAEEVNQDSVALVNFYNNNGGPDWTNNTNWLSEEDISEWFGVTAENGQVVGISLPDNNITGSLSGDIANLSALENLNLQNNELTSIPDLTGLANLVSADVSGNNLQFDALEANSGLPSLVYAPQAPIGESEEVKVSVHSSTSLSDTFTGTANTYQWYFEGEPISGATSPSLTIDNVDKSDMGSYYVEVKNSLLPDLTLTSNPDRIFATAGIAGNITDYPTDYDVTSTAVILLKVTASGGFDTTAIVAPEEEGAYSFSDVVLDKYQILADPDESAHPELLPTYYKSSIYWEEADTVNITDNLSALNITFQTFVPESLEGTGEISGIIEEEVPDEGRVFARRRVAKAGVSVRRVKRAGRKGLGNSRMLEDYELVAYLESNENGEFNFSGLPEDTYRLNIQYPGYPMDNTSFVDITVGLDNDGGTKENDKVAVEALVADGKIVVTDVTITSITRDPELASLQVHPNPTKGILYVQVEDNKELDVQLFDMKGKMLHHQKINSAVKEINLTTLPAGTYILNVKESDFGGINTYKVIIE